MFKRDFKKALNLLRIAKEACKDLMKVTISIIDAWVMVLIDIER